MVEKVLGEKVLRFIDLRDGLMFLVGEVGGAQLVEGAVEEAHTQPGNNVDFTNKLLKGYIRAIEIYKAHRSIEGLMFYKLVKTRANYEECVKWSK